MYSNSTKFALPCTHRLSRHLPTNHLELQAIVQWIGLHLHVIAMQDLAIEDLDRERVLDQPLDRPLQRPLRHSSFSAASGPAVPAG